MKDGVPVADDPATPAAGRTFLHVDMDAFFAAVEQHDHPEWRGKPVVVGAPPDQRGVVAAASYEAREFGIHSAMPSREAGKRCPHAVFVPPNGRRYEEVSRQVFHIFERFTPLVEPISIDEAFLDVTGSRRLFGTGRQIAVAIKAAVRRETGLTASVGVAPNKFLAKLSSELCKPDGLLVAPREPAAVLEFLAPLPVRRIWGVGEVLEGLLGRLGIRTIGDLQKAPPERLVRQLGKSSAEHLLSLARGIDERGIELDYQEKRMSREHTFDEDTSSVEELEQVLGGLAEDVGARLRAGGRYAGLAHLKLRWKGFQTITRQRPLDRPCCDDFTLRAAAFDLFHAQPLIKPVRLIGFGASRLTTHGDPQLSLFRDIPMLMEKRERLSRAVDQIRRKMGDESILRAAVCKEPRRNTP